MSGQLRGTWKRGSASYHLTHPFQHVYVAFLAISFPIILLTSVVVIFVCEYLHMCSVWLRRHRTQTAVRSKLRLITCILQLVARQSSSLLKTRLRASARSATMVRALVALAVSVSSVELETDRGVI